MPDIFHQFIVLADAEKVFDAVSRAEGLDSWWTKSSADNPVAGGIYRLYFGPEYDWEAIVTDYQPPSIFELQIRCADIEWNGTRIGFRLTKLDGKTGVDFYHAGWPSASDHYKISSYCWAMYLRILKRYVEYRERVPYEKRLDV